jgi:isocitrate/isopropylmalate dehydrogenase
MAKLLENEQTIREQQRLFDDVRPAGVRMFLLKRAEHSEKFAIVREVTSGWFASFDKQFRDELKVSVATLDAAFADEIAQSSFLAYGTTSPLDVYQFGKKDAVGPNATSPSWKVFATRVEAERFTII